MGAVSGLGSECMFVGGVCGATGVQCGDAGSWDSGSEDQQGREVLMRNLLQVGAAGAFKCLCYGGCFAANWC